MTATVAAVATVAILLGIGCFPPFLNYCRSQHPRFCDSSCDSAANYRIFRQFEQFSPDQFPCARVAGAGGPYTPLKGGYEAPPRCPMPWNGLNHEIRMEDRLDNVIQFPANVALTIKGQRLAKTLIAEGMGLGSGEESRLPVLEEVAEVLGQAWDYVTGEILAHSAAPVQLDLDDMVRRLIDARRQGSAA